MASSDMFSFIPACGGTVTFAQLKRQSMRGFSLFIYCKLSMRVVRCAVGCCESVCEHFIE